MSKRILFEANIFAKLLSFFYDQKAKGNDSALDKVVASAGNAETQKAYAVWKDKNEQLLIATRNLLVKSNLDTTDVDKLLKKYHNR